MSHTFHNDLYTYGLADNCPRCEYHADHIAQMDTSMLYLLKGRLEFGQPARSVNEGIAMNHLNDILTLARRLGLRETNVTIPGIAR